MPCHKKASLQTQTDKKSSRFFYIFKKSRTRDQCRHHPIKNYTCSNTTFFLVTFPTIENMTRPPYHPPQEWSNMISQNQCKFCDCDAQISRTLVKICKLYDIRGDAVSRQVLFILTHFKQRWKNSSHLKSSIFWLKLWQILVSLRFFFSLFIFQYDPFCAEPPSLRCKTPLISEKCHAIQWRKKRHLNCFPIHLLDSWFVFFVEQNKLARFTYWWARVSKNDTTSGMTHLSSRWSL